jgi:para-nitrobenzyl esterase
VKATTKEAFFTRFGQWSERAKAAYDPDGTTDLATMVSRANDDFGQAEPARFAASAFASNGSPAYLYRFGYVATAMRERMRNGTPTAERSGSSSVPSAGAPGRRRRPRPKIWPSLE